MSEHSSHGPLAHQFDDLPQQRNAEELGMWLFLTTEAMLFSGLFLAYTIYRSADPQAFAAASHQLDFWLGTINTFVLLFSSFTMALAVEAAHESNRQRLQQFLALTIVFGVLFLGIKGVEYYHKYEHGMIPFTGLPFHYSGPNPDHAKMFFGLYFTMTGVHAFHMLIGLALLGFLWFRASRGGLLGDYSMPVHIAGLYWHFVDIVWVFLFPLLYLIGEAA